MQTILAIEESNILDNSWHLTPRVFLLWIKIHLAIVKWKTVAKKSIEMFCILVMKHRDNPKSTLMMLACVNIDKAKGRILK